MKIDKKDIEERFEALFAEWEKVIQDPKIQLSSRPQDYLSNEPYQGMVKLGNGALPFIVEKLDQGVFLLNQAVVDITNTSMEDIIGKERRFISEQAKSAIIVEWWEVHKKDFDIDEGPNITFPPTPLIPTTGD
jgi:hypothetical protein